MTAEHRTLRRFGAMSGGRRGGWDRFAGRSKPLIVRARENPELFSEFYGELYEQAWAFFGREVLDPETAADLTSEAFCEAFIALPNFRGSTTEEGYKWFWTIARRRLYRWREVGRTEQVAMFQVGIQAPPLTDSEFERIEELSRLDARKIEIAAALASLKDDQRDAVTLRVLKELSYAEIGERLGVSEQVVRARVSRGLRRLSYLVQENIDDSEDVA